MYFGGQMTPQDKEEDHNKTKRKLKEFSQMLNWLMRYSILKF